MATRVNVILLHAELGGLPKPFVGSRLYCSARGDADDGPAGRPVCIDFDEPLTAERYWGKGALEFMGYPRDYSSRPVEWKLFVDAGSERRLIGAANELVPGLENARPGTLCMGSKGDRLFGPRCLAPATWRNLSQPLCDACADRARAAYRDPHTLGNVVCGGRPCTEAQIQAMIRPIQ